MASQGQAVARQHNRWLELVVIALAIAAIMITLGWGAFTTLSAPSAVAPSTTTDQILQKLDDERGGAVARPKSAPGNPYADGQARCRRICLGEHRRGERGMELPNGTFLDQSLSERRRGHPRERK